MYNLENICINTTNHFLPTAGCLRRQMRTSPCTPTVRATVYCYGAKLALSCAYETNPKENWMGRFQAQVEFAAPLSTYHNTLLHHNIMYYYYQYTLKF